jgi:SAM-dependent methyltransferase
MAEQASQAGGAPETVDFDALYRGDFDVLNRSEWVQAAGIEMDFLPWDIGEPQPVLRELERSGQIRSEVLDLGCGLGDNTLFLAERGYRVLGLDIAPAAIERASAQAQSQGLDVEFAVADVTALEEYERRFATVVDCGLYHGLTEQQRAAYLTAVHHVCQPAARLYIVCLADTTPLNFFVPYGTSETDLRNSLASASGWVIRSEPTTLTTAFTRHYIEQQAGPVARDAFDWARLRYDQQGRLLSPAWLAIVERTSDPASSRTVMTSPQRKPIS